MPKLQIPAPSAKQQQFLTDEHKYVCFGGARGGGKSWAVRVKAVLLCEKYPGIICCIIRKTYPELRANHIKQLRRMLRCGQKDALARYNDAEKTIYFPNGSTILFRYLDTESDEGRFQGTEVDVLFIDEATQHPEQRWDILRACLRGVNQYPKRIYLTCNPGGVGHSWVKRIFISRDFKPEEHPEEYTFIQSLLTDNKALLRQQPGYLDQLMSLPPKQRAAWLYGNWDIYDGQYFEDFCAEPNMPAAEAAGCELSREELKKQHRWVHVIEPFEIDPRWKIYRSFDWGYNRPFSCGWWAVDFDGVLYRILELYGCKKTPNEGVKWIPDEVFKKISQIESEHRWLKGKKILGVADPAIWDAETGVSIAEVASRHRVYFDKGDHARLPGWLQVHYRLAFDENGFAQMYVFSNCKAFIRTIPTLQYDMHRPEDLDTTGEDHVADEVRYLCMARPIKPRQMTVEVKDKPLQLFLDIEDKELPPAPSVHRMEILKDAE